MGTGIETIRAPSGPEPRTDRTRGASVALPDPTLTTWPTRAAARGVVLALHGGAARGLREVDRRSLSWRRCRAMLQAVHGALNDAGLDVWLLRYRYKGWNQGLADLPSPVRDVQWALGEVRRVHGQVPVVLLGHSMGARAAVAVADDPAVAGVVGLAPWWPPGEPVHPLANRHVVAAHGRRDRITSYRQTASFLLRASEVAASARLHDMGEVGHYMLRRRDAWNAFVVDGSLLVLGGAASSPVGWHDDRDG